MEKIPDGVHQNFRLFPKESFIIFNTPKLNIFQVFTRFRSRTVWYTQRQLKIPLLLHTMDGNYNEQIMTIYLFPFLHFSIDLIISGAN